MKRFVIRMYAHGEGVFIGRLCDMENGEETIFESGPELLKSLGIHCLTESGKTLESPMFNALHKEKMIESLN